METLANTDKQGKDERKYWSQQRERYFIKTLATSWLPCCFDEKDYELSTPDVEKQMLF
jgi:hypothetical protein